MISLLLFGLISVAMAICPAPLVEQDGVCKTQAQLYQSAKCCADSSGTGCAIYTPCAGGAAPATAVIKQSCTVVGLDATAINTPTAKAKLEGSIASILSTASGTTVLPSRVTVTGITTTARRRLAAGAKVDFTVQATSATEQTSLTTAANDIATGTNADSFKEAVATAGGQALSELGSVTAETAAADVQAVVTAGRTVTSALDGQNAVTGTLTATDVDGALTFAITGSVTGDTGTATMTDNTGAYKYTASSASFHGNAIFTVRATDPNGGTTDIVVTVTVPSPPPCDASAAPTNGDVGTCGASLASGDTCQPTCSVGFIVSGVTSCNDGTLVPATCVSEGPVASHYQLLTRGTSVPRIGGAITIQGDAKTCASNGLHEILTEADCRTASAFYWTEADSLHTTELSYMPTGCYVNCAGASNQVLDPSILNPGCQVWWNKNRIFEGQTDCYKGNTQCVCGTVTPPIVPCSDFGSIPDNGASMGDCTGTLADGDDCTHTCDAGFTAKPGRCRSGNFLPGVCEGNSCPFDTMVPSGTDGLVLGTTYACEANTLHGQRCKIECASGYRKDGDSWASCFAGSADVRYGMIPPSCVPFGSPNWGDYQLLTKHTNMDAYASSGYAYYEGGIGLTSSAQTCASQNLYEITTIEDCIAAASNFMLPISSHHGTQVELPLTINTIKTEISGEPKGCFVKCDPGQNQPGTMLDPSLPNGMCRIRWNIYPYDQDAAGVLIQVAYSNDTYTDHTRMTQDMCYTHTGQCVCSKVAPASAAAFKPADSAALKVAVDACLAETTDGTCPIFAASHGVIGDWDVSAVTSLKHLFQYSTINLDISKWDVSSVTNMYGVFEFATQFNQDISNWNTGAVTDMQWMFATASKFNQPLSNWNTGAVTNMYKMFYNAEVFNQDISGWDTSSLTKSGAMFVGTLYPVCTAYTASACTTDNKGVLARCAGATCVAADFSATGSCCVAPKTGCAAHWLLDVDSPYYNNHGITAGYACVDDFETCEAAGYSTIVSQEKCCEAYGPECSADTQIIQVTHPSYAPGCDTSMQLGIAGTTANCMSATAFCICAPASAAPTSCDASAAPTNGGVGDCTASLALGGTCQPVCDADYAVSGVASCSAKGFFTPATCTTTLTGCDAHWLMWVNNPYYNHGIAAGYTCVDDFATCEAAGYSTITTQEKCCEAYGPECSADTQIIQVTHPSYAPGCDTSMQLGIAGTTANCMSATAFCICASPPTFFKPAGYAALKVAVEACLAETSDGTCPIFAASDDTTGKPYGVIGDWDISAVTSLQNIFIAKKHFNQDLSKWDTSAVTSMSGTFMSSRVFNQDISSWDTSNVVTMHKMFANSWVFNQDISTWDTGAVTDMSSLFQSSKFNQDISGWDTGAVTNMAQMFTDSPYSGTLCGGAWESLTGTASAFTGLGSSTANKNCPCDASTPPNNGAVGTCTASLAPGSNCQPLCADGFTSSGVSSCAALGTVFTPSTCTRCSDASIAPTNGGVGDCTASLAPGSTCQPVCDNGFLSTGVHSCSAGGVFTPSTCTPPFKPVDTAGLKAAVDACISETPDGSCPDFAKTQDATGNMYGVIGGWDVSLVTSLTNMFSYKYSFNQDLSNWDTSAVTDMSNVFSSASVFNLDISSWDTSKVTTFQNMFRSAVAFDQDITGWDTSSATNMVTMFLDSGVTQSFCGGAWESLVATWSAFHNLGSSTANYQCPPPTFAPANKAALKAAVGTCHCSSNCFVEAGQVLNPTYSCTGGCLGETLDGSCPTLAATIVPGTTHTYGVIGDWDVSAVTNMESMFHMAFEFNQDLSKWDVSAVTNMDRTLQRCHMFNQDISGWNTGAVTSMQAMFAESDVFNSDLSSWDTSKVTDLSWMFYYTPAFNQDLSKWETGAVTNMAHMFQGAAAFNQDLSSWDTTSATLGSIFTNSGCSDGTCF